MCDQYWNISEQFSIVTNADRTFYCGWRGGEIHTHSLLCHSFEIELIFVSSSFIKFSMIECWELKYFDAFFCRSVFFFPKIKWATLQIPSEFPSWRLYGGLMSQEHCPHDIFEMPYESLKGRRSKRTKLLSTASVAYKFRYENSIQYKSRPYVSLHIIFLIRAELSRRMSPF